MTAHNLKSIQEQILNKEGFIRAVFTGYPKTLSPRWVKILVRPVDLKGQYNLQVSMFDGQKDISKNYAGEAAENRINEILNTPFRNIHIETTEKNIHVQRTKKGKIIIGDAKPSKQPGDASLSHDRRKEKILKLPEALHFLQAVDIAGENGRIKAEMQRKFRQINEFLRLIDEMDAFKDFEDRSINLVDFGCGKAYLTFALYFYLVKIKEIDTSMVGVDIKQEIIVQNRQRADKLGWKGLSFQVGSIGDYEPESKPDMVVALHACDTATDDAIAQGIRWGSSVILTAPCCQHELQQQLAQKPYPSQLSLISHFGILMEREGDILTDSFRAAILQIMGYRTDVTQFVSSEHTAKNLMIRALKTRKPGESHWADEYQRMKTFWKVTPYLERLISNELSPWLQNNVEG